MIVATAAAGLVHVSFVSNPWARIISTKDTFESKTFIFTNRIEFESIWWKHTNLAPIR